ncbi:MAG: hypothetical protein WDN45_08890 [Caulobacteraceae bacterium]
MGGLGGFLPFARPFLGALGAFLDPLLRFGQAFLGASNARVWAWSPTSRDLARAASI